MSIALIKLTQGRFAIIDEEDLERVEQHKWCLLVERTGSTYYAVAGMMEGKKQKHKLMHRFILNAPRGVQVDHINHNGLDNRKSNIRLATQLQNCHNRKKRKDARYSLFKGVRLNVRYGSWRACITLNRKRIDLGSFPTEKEAARAYDNAARKYFGEFAVLNFPND